MKKGFPGYETPRLLLRAIEFDDWPAIHRYMSDAEVTTWLPEGLLDEEQSRAFAVKNAGEGFEAVAAVSRDTKQMIGHMVFHAWGPYSTYEIGWVFAADHQRRGYATEAALSLLGHAFEVLRCNRVIATCQPQNTASWRVMERIGMRREGLFLKCIRRPSGEWWDEYFYAILAEEYFARRAARTPDSI